MKEHNMQKEITSIAYITYLESLKEDRAALAALRRGLGKPEGSAPEMYPYVVPWLPKEENRWRETYYYLIASLFAMHPDCAHDGNMGDHFALARSKSNSSSEAVERRFTALLSSHPEDLGFYLRQAISFLRSNEVPVQWHQLMHDIERWSHPQRYVQRQWANAFWRYQKLEEINSNQEEK
jgi:CRISPR system Cascade subunit CasB